MIKPFCDPDIYDSNLIACPLCKKDDIRRLCTITRYNPGFKIDSCSNCGFIFMNPRFTEKIIKNFYSEDYFLGNAEYSYNDERKMLKYSRIVWDKRINIIRKYMKEGNLLDIGAAFGGFLNAASRYFSPYGIEISPYAGSFAKKEFGNSIHIGTLDDHPFEDGFFSVISMIEVLEHMTDPVKTLRQCFDLLAQDGLLLVQTANMAGMQARILKDNYAYFMPGHFSYFTKLNLTGILKKTGFRKIVCYHPVEFGLLPKLLKSRGGYTGILDYTGWMRIILYHLLGKIHIKNFALTSSMVIYAVK